MPSLDIAKTVVVDGSNLATEGRSLPSYAQLKAALADFAAEFPKSKLTIIVDATFEHRIEKSEAKEFEKAEAAGKIITPPAGAIGRGDAFVLRIADKTNATVLSNDSFQEFHGEYEWLFTEGRLIGGKPVPGIGWVFTLRTPVRGPKSRVAVAEANKKRRKVEASELGYASLEEEVAARRAAGQKLPVAKSKRGDAASAREEVASKSTMSSTELSGSRRRRRPSATEPKPVNDVVPFLEFVGKHKVGSKLQGSIDAFASHGCYVVVDGVRCYLPLINMGSPAPRSPREAVKRGETLTLEVIGFQAARRSVELSIPGPLATAARKRFDDAQRKDADADVDLVSGATSRTRSRRGDANKIVAKSIEAKAGDGAKHAAKSVAKKVAKKAAPVKKTAAPKPVTKSTLKPVAKKAAPVKAAPAKKAVPVKRTAAPKPVTKSPAKKAAPVAKKAAVVKAAPAKKAASAKKAAPVKKTAAKAADKVPAKKVAKKSAR